MTKANVYLIAIVNKLNMLRNIFPVMACTFLIEMKSHVKIIEWY